jgi:hypothetical protein
VNPIVITAVLVTALMVTPQFMQVPPEKPMVAFEPLIKVKSRDVPEMR